MEDHEVKANDNESKVKIDPSGNLDNQKQDIRVKARDLLIEVSRTPRSMLSSEMIARLLGCTYRTVHRWFDPTGAWVPGPEMCDGIISFANAVKGLRSEWQPIVERWKGFGFENVDKEVRGLLFNPKFLCILEDPELNKPEKIEELTVRSLRVLAERMGRR